MTLRTRIPLALLLALAACGGSEGASVVDAPAVNDGPSADANPGCTVYVTFDPMAAVAGPDTQIRAMATALYAPGVIEYTWQVRRSGVDIPFAFAQADASAITFAAPQAGPYDVMVGISAPGQFCPTAQGTINIGVPGSNMTQVRLRVIPPASIAAPPNEKLVLVMGGASFSMGLVSVDPGIVASGQVSSGATGVQAYLRFIPLGARDAYVETFSGAGGTFSARVLNQVHDVLVVPLVAGYAPKLYQNWTPGTPITIEPGSSITGVVRGPSNAALAGAKVQLTINGIPSTLTTTGTDGSFTSRSIAVPPGATVAIDVTPPPASGLPRLLASSTAFDLAQPVQVRYSASLGVRDLAGVTVRRGGAAQANAKVAIVGTIASAGTVTAGTAAVANGEVRVSTTANASGVLPSTLAPATPLSAVVTLAAGDHAVEAFDLGPGVPAIIDAPPMVPVATAIREPGSAPIGGAIFEAVPLGALAMAGVGNLRVTSAGNGMVGANLASGGHYELRLTDPIGRGAAVVIADVTSSSLASAYTLLPALRVKGQLSLSGNPSPVGRASIQILCTACDGVDRTRPLAEGSSTGGGEFDVAVFDPGTM